MGKPWRRCRRCGARAWRGRDARRGRRWCRGGRGHAHFQRADHHLRPARFGGARRRCRGQSRAQRDRGLGRGRNRAGGWSAGGGGRGDGLERFALRWLRLERGIAVRLWSRRAFRRGFGLARRRRSATLPVRLGYDRGRRGQGNCGSHRRRRRYARRFGRGSVAVTPGDTAQFLDAAGKIEWRRRRSSARQGRGCGLWCGLRLHRCSRRPIRRVHGGRCCGRRRWRARTRGPTRRRHAPFERKHVEHGGRRTHQQSSGRKFRPNNRRGQRAQVGGRGHHPASTGTRRAMSA